MAIATVANQTQIWTSWTCTNTTATTDVWSTWTNGTASSTTTITYDAAWQWWVQDLPTGKVIHIREPIVQQPTREQIAARQEANRRYEQQAKEARRAREKAEKRAEQMLLTLLSEQQRRDLKRHNHFFVTGRVNRYRVRRGRYGNVDVIGPDGRATRSLCAHIPEECPDSDNMAAQKLMLECDDAAFVARANTRRFTGVEPQLLPALQ